MTKLLKEDYQYRRTENAVSSINYDFVLVPKPRKPEFPELKKLPALWTSTYFVATTSQLTTDSEAPRAYPLDGSQEVH